MPLTFLTWHTLNSSCNGCSYLICLYNKMHQYNLKRTTKIIEDTIYNPITKMSGCLCYFYDNQQGRLKIVITQWGSESLMRPTDS